MYCMILKTILSVQIVHRWSEVREISRQSFSNESVECSEMVDSCFQHHLQSLSFVRTIKGYAWSGEY